MVRRIEGSNGPLSSAPSGGVSGRLRKMSETVNEVGLATLGRRPGRIFRKGHNPEVARVAGRYLVSKRGR